MTEAARAVVEQARQEGLPYLTATHDRENPGSGGVMRKLGMVYQYSYEEQWQPKDIRVVFRLYQMDLDGSGRAREKLPGLLGPESGAFCGAGAGKRVGASIAGTPPMLGRVAFGW